MKKSKVLVSMVLAAIVFVVGNVSVSAQEVNGTIVEGCKTKISFSANHSETIQKKAKKVKNKYNLKMVCKSDKKSENPIDFSTDVIAGPDFNTAMKQHIEFRFGENEIYVGHIASGSMEIKYINPMLEGATTWKIIERNCYIKMAWKPSSFSVTMWSADDPSQTNIIADPTEGSINSAEKLEIAITNPEQTEYMAVFTYNIAYAGKAKTKTTKGVSLFNWKVNGKGGDK